MRRKILATSLALMALTAFAPSAGADGVDSSSDYICVRSRLLLGDPICVHFTDAE